MKTETLEITNRLLKIIIVLLIRIEFKDTLKLKGQIKILSDLGLKPSEISDILAKSGTHINKELSLMRRDKKRGE